MQAVPALRQAVLWEYDYTPHRYSRQVKLIFAGGAATAYEPHPPEPRPDPRREVSELVPAVFFSKVVSRRWWTRLSMAQVAPDEFGQPGRSGKTKPRRCGSRQGSFRGLRD